MGATRVQEQQSGSKGAASASSEELAAEQKDYVHKMFDFKQSMANLYKQSPIERAAQALEMQKDDVNPYPQLRKVTFCSLQSSLSIHPFFFFHSLQRR